jgi:hypothetical protein
MNLLGDTKSTQSGGTDAQSVDYTMNSKFNVDG